MIEKRGWLGRLAAGLKRTSSRLSEGIAGIFVKRRLDKETLAELEDLLISADLGPATAAKLVEELGRGRLDKEIGEEEIREVLAGSIAKLLEPVAKALIPDPAHKPFVVLVVGVNGSGKTTTIGKLAQFYREAGRRVVLAAGDTFRAAAIEQLGIWADRAGAGFVSGKAGGDAAGLAFEALEKAQKENADILLIDTAGRLSNKTHLMAELEKIARVLKKRDASAPHAVLLVLDATTGQNAITQVEAFRAAVPLTGLIMTKLDGTAKGGILVALAARSALPVHFIGVGEGEADLQVFDAETFAQALIGTA